MKKIATKIGLALLLLSFAIALSINIAILAFQGDIKQKLTEQVALNTPVTISINGDISWSLLKPLRLSVDQLSVFQQEQLLTDIEYASAAIALKSLWQNVITIKDIEINIDTIVWQKDTLQAFLEKQPAPQINESKENSSIVLVIENFNLNINKLEATQGNAYVKIERFAYQAKNITINTSNTLPLQEHEGELSIAVISVNDLSLQKLSLKADIRPNRIQAKLATGFASGTIIADISTDIAPNINLKLNQLMLQNLQIDQSLVDNIKQLEKLDLQLPKQEQNNKTPIKDNKGYALSNLFIEKVELEGINIALEQPNNIHLKNANMSFSNQAIFKDKKLLVKPPTKALTFALNADFSKLKIDDKTVNAFNLQATTNKQNIMIEDLSLNIFDGNIKSTGSIDASVATLPAKLSTTIQQLNIAALTEQTEYPSKGELFADIESQLLLLPEQPSDKSYIAASNNKIHIYNQGDIIIGNIDIDKLINSLQESANISWMDIGAVGLFGPVGLLYSTAVSVGKNNIKKDPGESTIDKVDLNITNNGSLISIKNSLISTEKNNISALGEIDYNNEAFKDFKIAFLNKKYCPTFIQQVSGTFEKPKIAANNLAKGLLFNTVGGLFSTKKLTGEQCTDFYSDSVD